MTNSMSSVRICFFVYCYICVDELTCLHLHGRDIRCIMMKENIKNQMLMGMCISLMER